MTDTGTRETEAVVEIQRDIQREVAADDRQEEERARPPCRREHANIPVPPFPEQHQAKPGEEAKLEPAPMYDAPFWKGSGKLEGKAALITGGDSGIGRAVAVLFAREGADVAVVHLPAWRGDAEVTRDAVLAEGRGAPHRGGLSEAAGCRDAVARAVAELGRLDILVNNAAFQDHVGTLDRAERRAVGRRPADQLHAYFHVAKAALPHLSPGRRHHQHRLDHRHRGIPCPARLCRHQGRHPRLHQVARAPAGEPRHAGQLPSRRGRCGHRSTRRAVAAPIAQFGEGTPMGRPAQPEEIAPAYVYLASPQCSSYISGEILSSHRRLLSRRYDRVLRRGAAE